MNKNLFITGMFRAGTTLLARMMNVHPQIVCASDPYRPFFNCFRDCIAEELEINIKPYAPLGDYFASIEELKLLQKIQSAHLNQPFPDNKRAELLKQIRSQGEPYSPKITEQLESISGDTFLEVYNNLMLLVPECYGSSNEEWTATKEVWCTEFVPVLARSYPEAKFMLIVRDPRAVCASKNVTDEKYPWLFLVRQWRKLSILTWVYKNLASFNDRVLLLRYEDLITNPEQTLQEICAFLRVAMDERALDPRNFVDGRGESWVQNTSYQDKKRTFNRSSIDNWKNALGNTVVEYIEQLCFAEMKCYNYKLEIARKLGLRDEIALSPPYVALDEMAEWIKEFYRDRNSVSHLNEVAKEKLRQELLLVPDGMIEGIDDEVLESFFLSREFLNLARRLVL